MTPKPRGWPRRIGAGSYLLAASAIAILWSIAVMATCLWPAVIDRLDHDKLRWLVAAYDATALLASYPLTTSRLRDLSLSTAWSRWAAFPLTMGVMLPMLCFWSGPRWDNGNGPAPESSGLLKIVAGVVASAIAMMLLNAAIRAYVQAQAAFP